MLSARVVDDLGAIDLGALEGPLARQVLVLTRPDRPTPRRLTEGLGHENVEWGAAKGQAELVGVLPDDARLPAETIEHIATWLATQLDGDPGEVVAVGRISAVLAAGTEDEVVERAVRLGFRGPVRRGRRTSSSGG